MHWKNLYHATCSGPLITKGVFIKGVLGAVRENAAGGGNGDAIKGKFELDLKYSFK